MATPPDSRQVKKAKTTHTPTDFLSLVRQSQRFTYPPTEDKAARYHDAIQQSPLLRTQWRFDSVESPPKFFNVTVRDLSFDLTQAINRSLPNLMPDPSRPSSSNFAEVPMGQRLGFYLYPMKKIDPNPSDSKAVLM